MKSAHQTSIYLLLLSALLFAAGAFGNQPNRVAVKAKASPEYIKSRAADPSKKIQTYHVIKGKYFGGNTDDPSMEAVTFLEIAENMAANLRRQNFVAEPDPDKGDLLILVNYGATDYDADYMELMGVDSLDDLGFGTETDTSEFDEFEAEEAFAADFMAMRAFNEGGRMSMLFKSKLLGLEEMFDDRATDQDVYEFRDMVSEERYFVFLVAFDLPAYRKGEKKVMWTTRYSMRAIGQPFDVAIGELNYVAGNFFGKNLDGLYSRRATDDSEVRIGEIEVLGQEEAEETD